MMEILKILAPKTSSYSIGGFSFDSLSQSDIARLLAGLGPVQNEVARAVGAGDELAKKRLKNMVIQRLTPLIKKEPIREGLAKAIVNVAVEPQTCTVCKGRGEIELSKHSKGTHHQHRHMGEFKGPTSGGGRAYQCKKCESTGLIKPSQQEIAERYCQISLTAYRRTRSGYPSYNYIFDAEVKRLAIASQEAFYHIMTKIKADFDDD